MDLRHISILKELLRRHIHPIKGDILQTLNKGIIKRLGETLDIHNLRIYLFTTSGRKIQERQIVGDSSEWKIVDIEKVRQDVAVYKNLHFIKIKYANDDGRSLTIGFLGVHRDKLLNPSEIGLLELLCMLYGDYVRKRMSLTIDLKIREQLPNIIKIANSGGLPGTIISKCLDAFHRSFNAYASYYCVIDSNSFIVDYIKLSNSGTAFYPKSKAISVSNHFLASLQNKYSIINAEDKRLDSIFERFQYYDNKLTSDFLFLFYPTKNDNSIIGCWLFIFSNRQFFDSEEVANLIDATNTLIELNYKYLYQRKTSKMIVEPIFKNRDTRINKKKIFTLMPFTLDWSNRIWQQMIKPVVEASGYDAIRADDLFGHDIMEDIWSSILSAHLVIADITGRNPNVFYELGIAHTLGKKVILLTQNKDDIPFDLNRYRHIIYQDNFDGYEVLKKKLEGAIKDLSK